MTATPAVFRPQAKTGTCTTDTICTVASTAGLYATSKGASSAVRYNQCDQDSDCTGYTTDLSTPPVPISDLCCDDDCIFFFKN